MDKKEWCKKIDDAYNLIKKPLIMAFTEFYGKEYEDKIRFVIENLVIFKLGPNLSNEKFIEKKKECLRKLNEKVICVARNMGFNFDSVDSLEIASKLEKCKRSELANIKSRYPKLDIDSFIDIIKLKNNYDYYDFCMSYNQDTEYDNVILGIKNSEKLTVKELTDITLNILTRKDSDLFNANAYVSFFYPIIDIKSPNLNISVLIHEINHLLRKKIALDIPENKELAKRNKYYGVNNYVKTDDLFYELINEMMTRDVFDIFNKYYYENDNYLLVNKTVDYDWYMIINRFTMGIVENIYFKFSDVIKHILIDDGGDKLIDVIGLNNYSMLSGRLKLVYYDIKERLRQEVPKQGIDPYDLEVLNSASLVVCDKLSQYQQKKEAHKLL